MKFSLKKLMSDNSSSGKSPSIPLYERGNSCSLLFDATRALREASRQLKLISHFVPLLPRLQGWAFSAHTGKRRAGEDFDYRVHSIDNPACSRGQLLALTARLTSMSLGSQQLFLLFRNRVEVHKKRGSLDNIEPP